MKKLFSIILIVISISSYSFAQGKVTGKTYFDYTYNSDGAPTNGFELHRVYIGYQAILTENISYKVTTDIGRFGTGKDDRLSVYLKNALVSWKTPVGKFVLGLQGLNIFKIQEANWGYRFVEKSPMDLNKFASSADLGIGYYNKFGKKINFSAIISNGSGYKKSEKDDYKKISLQIFYGDSKIKTNGNFNIGAIFTNESFDYIVDTKTTTETKSVFGGFAMYKLSGLKFGIEYDMMNTGGSNVTKNIISAYANYSVNKKLDVFARFDKYDPSTDVENDGSTYFLGGINYKPGKGLYIAPNIRISSPEQGESITIYKLNFQFKI